MNRVLYIVLLVFFAGWAGATEEPRRDRVAEAIEASPEKTFLVYLYEIKENIGPPARHRTQRAFEEADSLNADFILLHMNTYGGTVNDADSIRTRIMQSRIPVMVFIDNNAASAGALISIAADRIYMRPGGNIGAATVVDATGEEVPDKFNHTCAPPCVLRPKPRAVIPTSHRPW